VKPGTMYGERLHQIDVRVSKEIALRSVRVRPLFDIYNLLNGNVAVLLNNTFGASWQSPTSVLGGRLAKLGVQITF